MNAGIKYTFLLSLTLIIASIAFTSFKQNKEPWSPKQLLDAADLAKTLNTHKAKQPIIYCIGPDAIIMGSIDIGPAQDKANLDKLKEQLRKLRKDVDIVIYCGCCPFEHCPNIRPAFTLLNKMKFTNQKLLALQHNIKKDWINKGFPVHK